MSAISTTTAPAIPAPASILNRLAVLAYGVGSYALFLAVFLYTAGFVGGFFVPKTIENGSESGLGTTLAVDVSLMALFAIQHSVMARPWFKKWWTQYVPPVLERSTFVLFATLALGLLLWQWRPLPGVVWQVRSPIGIALVDAVCFAGWGIVLYATFIIDHFELFGLKQTVGYAFGRRAGSPKFAERSLYRVVRHPLMLGFLIAFWAAPVMSPGRLLFAGVITTWVLMAIRIEERTLVAMHGAEYESYRRRVPALLPTLRARTKNENGESR